MMTLVLGLASPVLAQIEDQRGDFAVGYAFLHEEGASMPLGFTVSDGFRVHPNVDVVVEAQYAHGNVDLIVTDVGLSVWAVQGGVRGWGGSRYGNRVRAFGQVLTGVGKLTGSVGGLGSVSTTGWTLQPGGGVEIPVTGTVAVRPQFDVLFGRLDGVWANDPRVNINVVFRLFR
jgi:hypothetical protein